MVESYSKRLDEEEKMRQEGRLPPGQSLTLKFPVLHYGPVPQFNPATWDFRVWGEIEQEKRWTWDEFNHLPRTSLVMDVHCVSHWSIFDTEWEGVTLRTLVEKGTIQVKPAAVYVIEHAENGYTTNLPLKVVMAENFLLATHFKGEPLTPDHGYPLRAIVGFIPGRDGSITPYFWKGAKWLRGLEFRKDDRPGFWEQVGFHNEADVWREERYG
jgi:DMSO/TMAO reductase YedYZ molybdopterin-dependent catalytic subunit